MSQYSIGGSIRSYEQQIETLQKQIQTCKNNIAEMETASMELSQIESQYSEEYRNVYSSYPGKILAADALRLNGVEKIQTAVRDAYTGTKRTNFETKIVGTLQSLKQKIEQENNKMANKYISINNIQNTITSLKKAFS